MGQQDTFTRRICAVLLADVTGFSALVGEDDERTARTIRRLGSIVLEIVAEAKGHAEARAGDAILATFDSVVAAVDAALAIHRRIAAEEFAGRRLQVRIGIHFGDVLLREGASSAEAVGDAINIAARLQALAKPGTVCISDGVYRHVRNRFDEQFVDLGNQQLKNISGPVHAYLIVPRELADTSLHARRHSTLKYASALVGLALVALAAVIVSQQYQKASRAKPAEPKPQSVTGVVPGAKEPAQPVAPVAAEIPEKPEQVALGVMLFKSRGGDGENDWRREALRDGLNTQLSQLSRVKVYSKEFIDFLITRKGLTEIEAATQLGIRKMLSGSFVVMNGTMRIETHIVDVQTGVLEASYTTSGREADFLNLQNQVAFGAISHLDLPVTEAEKQLLLAQRNTDEEALKMLLEAEGGAAPAAQPKQPPGPHSALPQWLALPRVLAAAPARADDRGPQTAILEAIERYRKAMEARDLQALGAIYADFPPEQQAAQQRYFDNVRDLKISIENPDIAVVGDEAVVSYTRTDDFIDARTGRPMHVAVRLTKILRNQNGEWKMAGK